MSNMLLSLVAAIRTAAETCLGQLTSPSEPSDLLKSQYACPEAVEYRTSAGQLCALR